MTVRPFASSGICRELRSQIRPRDLASPGGCDLEKLTLGVELYGGLGGSVLGLTIDPGKTQQYLGVNAILRLTAGYEFE